MVSYLWVYESFCHLITWLSLNVYKILVVPIPVDIVKLQLRLEGVSRKTNRSLCATCQAFRKAESHQDSQGNIAVLVHHWENKHVGDIWPCEIWKWDNQSQF